MKKVLSVIISLALILGSITCIFTGTASAESVWGTTAKYRYEINFDNDETKNAALTQARTELLSAEGYDGKTSNMLHIKEGVYKDATFLNWGTTTKNTDDVFTVPVNPSSTYQISWRVKIKTETVMSDTVTKKWFAFYTYYDSEGTNKSKSIADVAKAQRDTWLEYNVKFTTEADQTKLSFTFNAGGAGALDTATPEAWIDDIVIEESPYSDASKWGFYGTGAQLDGSAAATTNHSKGWPSISNDTAEDVNSDGNSIYINGRQAYAAVVLPKLEQKNKYRFSFKYFVPAGLSVNATSGYTGFMQYAGIAAKGTALAGEQNTYHPATYVAEGTSLAGPSGSWVDYSIEFYSGDNTEFVFGAHMHGGWVLNDDGTYSNGTFQIWLDDFSLEELPLDMGEGYFETLSNWILDKNSSTAIGSTDASSDISKAIVNNTPAATEKSNYALELSANKSARASVKLNVKANREYRVSFSFYSDAIGSNDSSILNMGIYAPDAENAALNWRSNPNGVYGYLGYMAYNIFQYESPDTTYTNRKSVGKNTTITNYPTGQWNNVSFNFTSEDYTNLYFTATIAGCTVYFDNFELVEAKLYHDYDNPPNETVITFDDNRPYSKSISSNMKIEGAPLAIDASVTNALHIVGGEYSSNTVLSWSNTWGKDEDLTFSLPVKENTYYKWSAWVYMPADQNCEYFAFYADKNATNTYSNYASVLNANKGKWVKLTQSFKTLDGQTKASTTFNLGGANKEYAIPDIYIDNITLTLVESSSSVTVRFETNGGSKVASVSGKVDTRLVLPVSTKAGYTFSGWYTDPNFISMFSGDKFPIYDMVLYAKWTKYTDSGWGYMPSQSFETWSDFSNIQYPVTTNMESTLFVGSAPSGVTGHTGSKVLQYNNTASSSKTAAIMLNPGDSNGSDRLPLNNYYLLQDGGALDVTFRYKVISGTANVNFYVTTANWNVYANNLIPDAKSSVNALNTSSSNWQTVTIRVPFIPREDAEECYGLAFNVSGSAGANIIFDDFSVKPTEKSTITFDTKNGLEISPITNYAGSFLTLPKPSVKTGKYFAGWYLDSELTNLFNETIHPDHNITLYAKWVKEEDEALKGWFDQPVQDFETWNNSKTGATLPLSTENNATISVGTPISGSAYSGENVFNYQRNWWINNKDNGVLLNVNNDRRSLEHENALPGDVAGKVEISFRYKLLKGSASVYFKTITADSGALGNITIGVSDTASNSVTLSTSSDWQSASLIYDIPAGAQQGLGMWIKSDNDSTQLMIDDVSIDHYEEPIEVSGVVTAYNSKAAIRTETENTKQGLRLYHAVDKDWITSNDIVEYGIIAVRTTKLEENGFSELTLDSVDKVFKKGRGIAWHRENQTVPTLWRDTEQEYIFTSVLTGIEEKYYDDSFSVRAYAINAKEMVFYGDVTETSIYKVADAIFSDPNSSEVDLAAANEVIDKAEEAQKTSPDKVQTYDEVYAANVSVNNVDSAIVNSNFHGINMIHQLYNYMPDVYNRTYNDSQIALEKETFEKMRVKKIRSFYGSSLSYNSNTKTHDFENSKYMQAFVQNCLDMQELGIEVGITPQWSLTAMFNGNSSAMTQGVNLYNAGYLVLNDDGSVNEDASAKAFGEFMYDSLLYLRARGVNNIKQLFCFTECNNVLGGYSYSTRDYEKIAPVFGKMITQLDEGLKGSGGSESIRQDYQIIAPCDNWRGDEEYGKSYLVEYCINNLSDKVDVIGSHNSYARSYKFTDDNFYNHPFDSNKTSIEAAHSVGKEFWIDEYNVDESARGSEQTSSAATRAKKSDPMMGVALGSMINGVLNSGVSNTYLWALYDQQWPNHTNGGVDAEFNNGVHVVGFLPTYLESDTPRAAWYATSLLTRYIGSGTVYQTEVDENVQSLYVSAIDRDDGEFTILVTNYNHKNMPLNISLDTSLGGKTLYRYVYNPNKIVPTSAHELIKSDLKIENVANAFSDTVSGNSVVVYTTEKPE